MSNLGVKLGIPSLMLLAGCGITNKKAEVSKPNIIYILADDMGYGDLGCFGQKEIKTPAIDQLAAEGMRFTRHYSGSPVCAPSRCTLMTGLHTGHAKVRGNNPTVELDQRDTTITTLLKGAGYKTAVIGKWGLGEENSKGRPGLQGVDYFFGYLNQIEAHNFYIDSLFRNNEKIGIGNHVTICDQGYAKGVGSATVDKKVYSHDLFIQEALDFVDQSAKSPFFLYLAVTIPHANDEFWVVKDEHGMEVPDYGIYKDKNWPNAQKGLAAMITYLDKDVARLRAKLTELGIDKNTVIMFASDNGPHAEGGNDPKFFNSNGGLKGQKRDLYEGGVRIPMIACWPGKIKPNQVTNHISAFWDIMPTITEIVGIPTPKRTDGISFLPTLLGKEQKQHDNLYWEFNEQGGKQAVLKGNWKLVKLDLFKPEKTRIELYNLETDPSEQNDISKNHPEIVAELTALLVSEHTDDANFPLNKIEK